MLRAVIIAFVLGLLPGTSHAQTELFPGYGGRQFMFSTDKVYVGGDFVYPASVAPGTPIKVSLLGNNASNPGSLSVINPRTAQEIYLFSNKEPPRQVDVSAYFKPGDRVIFKYVNETPLIVEDGWPKFTGPNQNPSDPYFSQATSDAHEDPAKRWGHRWSVVGKSEDYPGELEFGFEDATHTNKDNGYTDMDFDDIVYRVSGLQMAGTGRNLAKRSLIW